MPFSVVTIAIHFNREKKEMFVEQYLSRDTHNNSDRSELPIYSSNRFLKPDKWEHLVQKDEKNAKSSV